jgi:DMSO reductase anchor subunit
MKAAVSVFNGAFLFWATAIYMGTGWSMWLFSFPIVPQLRPDNYYYVFVPQVAYATKFFTPLTWIMMGCALLMLILEWKGGIRWVPAVVLLLVGIAGWVTVQYIFPYNRQMTAGIHDPAQLQEILKNWTRLSTMRMWMWTAEWSAMMYYFGRRTYDAIQARMTAQTAPVARPTAV